MGARTGTPPTEGLSAGVGSDTLFRLLISCADRPGIVAAVSGFLARTGAHIVTSAQYSTDPDGGAFFMRIEFHLPTLTPGERAGFEQSFAREVGAPLELDWRLWDSSHAKRVAVLVSRYDHCLLDLLWRWRSHQMEADLVLVASNHPDLRADTEAFGLPYHHIPVPKGEKPAAEAALLRLLGEANVDVVVLARYMQILSAEFLERVGVPLINIHHSFLPAFAGPGPYERAKVRGVKLIGATAHYVTEELDAGPIIEQDVIRVTHQETAQDLERLGADIERNVFTRAVKWHCEDRVLVYGNTTVVF